MIVVGLTGGIGSGKSTVANMFRELEVPVYDSDEEAKQLMISSGKIKKSIISLLGKKAYSEGNLNRSYIANRVFNNPDLLQQLNDIVHPEVRKHFLDWVDDQTSNYVIQETALIFENGAQDNYDHVLLVTAPIELRLQRVMERDATSEQEVMGRMNNQMDDSEKMELADFCIENLDLETTKKAVKKLHRKLNRPNH
ncbi:dephospho-CoA kinase [Flagellimonas sp. S3867]|uniref:dephospho-CoA kinase n=1 Tax=Flagellimonas sp. S3867 TaxID=2768063 RepID=UPI00168968FD|nr:dephospho-CoA kinase [Flagellimonas sp. S3867]